MSNQNLPIIFFPIETTVRELDGKLLLTTHLIKHGYKVVLGSRQKIKQEILTHINCIYIAKSVTIEEEEFYVQLKKLGHKIMILHAEGGVLYKDYSESLKYSYPEKVIPYIDVIFAYGQEISDGILKTIKNVKKNSVVISGEPRFDLMKPAYNSIYSQEVNSIKSIYGKYILINTSFGLSNHLISEEFAKNLIKNNPNFSDSLKANLYSKLEEFKVICKDFIELTLHLSEQFPDLNFVLRPHPEEKIETYSRAFNGCTNVFVTNHGNVAKWIRGSLAVIHYDCTTGIEAYFQEKPVFAYVPRKNDQHVAWLPIFVSEEYSNKLDITNAIQNAVLDNKFNISDKNQKDEVLNSFIANVKLKTTDVIIKVINEQIKNSNQRMKVILPTLYILRLKTFLLDNYLRIRNPKISPSLVKLGRLEPKDIKRKLNDIAIIENMNLNIKVKELNMNLIKIMNK